MTIYDWLESLGIKYHQSELYEIALTHTSFLNEHKKSHTDNERLEFLGDSVLQLWSADKLFREKPPLNEGQMTRTRAQLVCEKALAEYSRQVGLPQYLKLGIGEEKTGGRDKDSVIADMFEAMLGAIYCDTGFEGASILLDKVVTPILEHPETTGMIDYKSKLQEYVQADYREGVQYHLAETKGTSNNPTFKVEAIVDKVVWGVGIGASKKKAAQEAAKDALSKIAR